MNAKVIKQNNYKTIRPDIRPKGQSILLNRSENMSQININKDYEDVTSEECNSKASVVMIGSFDGTLDVMTFNLSFIKLIGVLSNRKPFNLKIAFKQMNHLWSSSSPLKTYLFIALKSQHMKQIYVFLEMDLDFNDSNYQSLDYISLIFENEMERKLIQSLVEDLSCGKVSANHMEMSQSIADYLVQNAKIVQQMICATNGSAVEQSLRQQLAQRRDQLKNQMDERLKVFSQFITNVWYCSLCKRTMSQTVSGVVALSCGDVLCNDCFDQCVRVSKECPDCKKAININYTESAIRFRLN